MADLIRASSQRRCVSVAVAPEPEAKKFNGLESNTLSFIGGRAVGMSGNANVKHVAGGATTNERIYLIRNGLVASKVNVVLFHECPTSVSGTH